MTEPIEFLFCQQCKLILCPDHADKHEHKEAITRYHPTSRLNKFVECYDCVYERLVLKSSVATIRVEDKDNIVFISTPNIGHKLVAPQEAPNAYRISQIVVFYDIIKPNGTVVPSNHISFNLANIIDNRIGGEFITVKDGLIQLWIYDKLIWQTRLS